MPHLGKKTALIILGDVGFNFHMNMKDKVRKEKASLFETYIYCVRGNHEQRPSKMPFMVEEYDERVGNFVWFEEEYPYIRYFQDGEIYNINDYKTLVLGGAYSIDKEFRLALGWPWFPGEQLNQLERDYIQEQVKGKKFDLILSHTCPISFCPTELFLKSIDQTKIDKTYTGLYFNTSDLNIYFNHKVIDDLEFLVGILPTLNEGEGLLYYEKEEIFS